ncbi:MAG: hypothetical protein JNK82_36790 [Myxococcaceae bacterium]|nr:hypothetical protein [Myxococcaceae bacterium]
MSLLPAAGAAQQAIVSLPSADQTPRGEVFFMHETQARPWGPKPYWNTTHFLTYGLTDDVELAATLFNAGWPSSSDASLALGYKGNLALPGLEAIEGKLTTGLMAVVSLTTQGVGAWGYAFASVRLPVLRTRLAAGFSSGPKQLFLTRSDTACFIGSIEQPVPFTRGKLNLVAEWFSGDHDLANVIVGATFHPNHNLIFVVGYKVPTAKSRQFREAKEAVVGEIGVFF